MSSSSCGSFGKRLEVVAIAESGRRSQFAGDHGECSKARQPFYHGLRHRRVGSGAKGPFLMIQPGDRVRPEQLEYISVKAEREDQVERREGVVLVGEQAFGVTGDRGNVILDGFEPSQIGRLAMTGSSGSNAGQPQMLAEVAQIDRLVKKVVVWQLGQHWVGQVRLPVGLLND